MTHNGWENYETWLFWSHMSNDGYWYNEMHRLTRKCLDEDDAIYDLANHLEAMMRDEIYIGFSSDLPILTDIVESVISEVRWREIAENLLDDYKPETDEEGALIIEFVTDESKSES